MKTVEQYGNRFVVPLIWTMSDENTEDVGETAASYVEDNLETILHTFEQSDDQVARAIAMALLAEHSDVDLSGLEEEIEEYAEED